MRDGLTGVLESDYRCQGELTTPSAGQASAHVLKGFGIRGSGIGQVA